MHLQDVKYLISTSREGGALQVLDLTVSPPVPVALTALPPLNQRLESIVR
jgi:hypothetical protein